MANFTKIFKEEITRILYNLFPKLGLKETPLSFYEASITLIPKADKDSGKKKTTDNILHEYRYKISQQSNSKRIQQYNKKNKTHNQMRFSRKYKPGSILENQSMISSYENLKRGKAI